MENKNTLVAMIVIAIIAILGVFTPTGKTIVEKTIETVGGAAGPDHTQPESFHNGIQLGGRLATSTSNSAETLLARTLENVSLIDYTLNVQDATLTFPASSSIYFLRNAGDRKTYWLRNATTTATMDLTIAAGTGLNMKNATITPIIVGQTDGGNAAEITLVRQADSDIDMYVNIFVEEN